MPQETVGLSRTSTPPTNRKDRTMFYMTDNARRSAAERIDDIIIDLAQSSGAMRDMGATEVQDAINFLKMLQRAIGREMTDRRLRHDQ